MPHSRKASKSGSGSPTAVTPDFIGQVYIDEDTNFAYVSNALTQGAWVGLTDSPTLQNPLIQRDPIYVGFDPEGGVWAEFKRIGSDLFPIFCGGGIHVDLNFGTVFPTPPFLFLNSGLLLYTSSGGSVVSIEEQGGACRITTAASLNASETIEQGDISGPVNTWLVERCANMALYYRYPTEGDKTNLYLEGGLYGDADNYILVKYDSSDPIAKSYFETKKDGISTRTNFPESPAGIFYCIRIFSRTVNGTFVAKLGLEAVDIAVTHTTNVPSCLLRHRLFVKTLDDDEKRFDLGHVKIIQQNPC